MIISSVTSLQGEPEMSAHEPIQLPEEAVAEDFNKCLETSSLPESLEDSTCAGETNEFESVYVPSPFEQYENEGARESPVILEDKPKNELPGTSHIDNTQGTYMVDGPPVKLVSVDNIMQGQKTMGRPKLFRPSVEFVKYLQRVKLKSNNYYKVGEARMGRIRGRRGRPPKRKHRTAINAPPEIKGNDLVDDNETQGDMSLESNKEVSLTLNKKRGRKFKTTVSAEKDLKVEVEEGENRAEKELEVKAKEGENRNRPIRQRTKPDILVITPERRRKRQQIQNRKSKEESDKRQQIQNRKSKEESDKRQQIQNRKSEEESDKSADLEIVSNNIEANDSVVGSSVTKTSSPESTTVEKEEKKGQPCVKFKRPKKSSGTGAFKCEQCGRRYCYLRGLRQHIRLECNVPPQFPCPFCPMRYRYRQCIREHVKTVHPLAYPKWYSLHFIQPCIQKYSKKKSSSE